MKNYFYPESVAVFGVSHSPSNLARIIVENLERFGYQGRVYPVGSSTGVLAGWNIVESLEEVEETPDLAVLLIPAARIPERLEECGKRGIRHVIVESGGFSEFSEERGSLEEEVRAVSRKWGMKVIGPNCFGVINLERGLVLPFFILKPSYMKAGHISLISQSGGILYDTCMLASCESIGLNKLVSIGNKLLLDENQCLEYFVSDEGTRVIGLYLEDFCDGRRLLEIAASTTKPIVLLKANRSAAGREIARFHTTALAGDARVAEAALREAGIIQVESLAEMIDTFKILSLPPLKGNRLALITRSGGHGVLAADGASRYGFELAPLSDDFFSAVKEMKINVIRTTNPVDIGDVYDLDAYREIMDRALREEDADGVVFVITYSSETDGLKVQGFIRHARERSPLSGKPFALCLVSNSEQWPLIKESADFPIFTDVDHALKSLARSRDHFASVSLREPLRARLRGTKEGAPAAGRSPEILPSSEVFSLLGDAGLPVAPYGVSSGLEEALTLAARIGYPVAMKIESPRILHKTEAKGVALNVAGPEELSRLWQEMGGTEYLIQKMAAPGHEVIVGGKRDQEFGHILLFGLGGIFVEVFREPAIRLVPLDEKTAARMVDETPGAAILKGFRGKPKADIAALVKTMLAVSAMLASHPEVKSLDINPLIVHEEGGGCTIVDARIEADR